MNTDNDQEGTIKEKLKRMFSLSEDTASNDEIRTRLLDGGKVTGTNMCVLVCAMVIASVGLNMGSTAVIIGAMLLSLRQSRARNAITQTATTIIRLLFSLFITHLPYHYSKILLI